MLRALFVLSACTVLLSACGRTVVRETVVERPVVTRETVVQTPAPVAPVVTRETVIHSPASVGAAPLACSLGTNAYSSGTLSCQSGLQHRCNNGVWERIVNSTC